MVLLSFDIEEFDAPKEYGAEISFERQIELSSQGLCRILDILARNGVKATFFVTANYALCCKDMVKRIVSEGHEIASHGFFHTGSYDGDISDSKTTLEGISGEEITGYRSPRMSGADNKTLAAAGYVYNSSLNPTFLPGRYNHLDKPRSIYMEDGVIQIPASVSATLRLPLFWLALHNMPLWLYKKLVCGAIKRDGYLNVYFHPWEFCDALHDSELNIPFIIKRNSGKKHAARLENIIKYLKVKGYGFTTINSYLTDLK